MAVPVKPETQNRRVSVVMVSYMTGPSLLEAVEAVQRDSFIDELIIVDNGNSAVDRAHLYDVVSECDNVRILQGHGNVGFARGCNYGAALAVGHYLFFLNPDTVVESGAAKALVTAGETARRPWLMGGLLLCSLGHEQRGARRDRLTFKTAFTSFTPIHRLPGFRSIHRDNEPMPAGPVPMPTVSGASILMDRPSFEQIGGFDPGYFLHVEDIAICRSTRTAGGDVMFVPGARAMHHGSTSDVTPWQVEWHKLKGFLRYFWTGSPGFWPKAGTFLVAPFMAGALFARFAVLSLRRTLRRR